MLIIRELKIEGFEKVIEATDPQRGLHCFIAIHDSSLGPSLGGTRIYPYLTTEDALDDVLRLAKAMTYKSAVAQDGLGGGKSVIIANPKTDKTKPLLHAFAEVVNSLDGKYIAAEDVGSTQDDMTIMSQKTPYVSSLPTQPSSGDPSRFTAWGVFRGIQAVAQHLWQSTCLNKRTIAIQGLGHVGSKLANILFWEGADLILTDIDETKAKDYAYQMGAKTIKSQDFCSYECDILAPCALGPVITEQTLALLKCKAIAGAANNQLLDDSLGRNLMEKGILYAPDYIINSGGIINASAEFEPGGYNPKFVLKKVNRVYETLLGIFQQADQKHKSTNEVANEIAEYNLLHAIGKREKPISFKR